MMHIILAKMKNQKKINTNTETEHHIQCEMIKNIFNILFIAKYVSIEVAK